MYANKYLNYNFDYFTHPYTYHVRQVSQNMVISVSGI
jgi:hypothetical protein